MKLLLSITIATTFLANAAYSGTDASVICASFSVFNADESQHQAHAFGEEKCISSNPDLIARAFAGIPGHAIPIYNFYHDDAVFDMVDPLPYLSREFNLKPSTDGLNPDPTGEKFFLVNQDETKCLGTNLKSSLPRMAVIGSNNCWVFRVNQL